MSERVMLYRDATTLDDYFRGRVRHIPYEEVFLPCEDEKVFLSPEEKQNEPRKDNACT